jgi:hypothetical protein
MYHQHDLTAQHACITHSGTTVFFDKKLCVECYLPQYVTCKMNPTYYYYYMYYAFLGHLAYMLIINLLGSVSPETQLMVVHYAGSPFISQEFKDAWKSSTIGLYLAVTMHQEQHHTTISMLAHACLSDILKYHAVLYILKVLLVLLIEYLRTKTNEPVTPSGLYHHKKPILGSFRLFGCPVFTKKYTMTTTPGEVKKYTTSHRCVRGIFIDFLPNQQGWLLYLPYSWCISVSNDIAFVYFFASALSYNDTTFLDVLPLRPLHTPRPTATVIERQAIPTLPPLPLRRGLAPYYTLTQTQ